MRRGVADHPIDNAFIKNTKAVKTGDSMQDILPLVASNLWPVPVVDEHNVYRGVVSKNRFLVTLHRTEDALEKQMEETDS